jgi:hypothetical protein
MLIQLVIDQWKVEKKWIDDALSTPRTKAYLTWKEELKNARKERRKRSAQERDAAKARIASIAVAASSKVQANSKSKEAIGEKKHLQGKKKEEEIVPIKKKSKKHQ